MRKTLVVAFAAVSSLVATSASAAEPAVVSPGWNGEALLAVGFHDGVGLGMGVRAGYTLPDPNIYLGGTFLYHFGNNNVNVYYLGFEGGYDIAAGPVIVRPFLGIGPVWSHYSGAVAVPPFVVANASTTNSDFGFWPGATVAYPINDRFFVGGDARVLIVNNFDTFILSGMGGMNF